MGERQDTLIRAVQISHETSAKGKGISPALEKKKAEIKFLKFDPSESSFDVDPPNIIPKRAYKKKRETKCFSMLYIYTFPKILMETDLVHFTCPLFD